MIEEHILSRLIKLTIDKKYNEIKDLLELKEYTSKFKGDIFELYIQELYRGNGWICKRVGGKGDRGADLLLSHPNEPQRILHIIQAKNHYKPLSFKDTRSELVQFEEVASSEYSCYDYKLISINGFANSTYDIENLDRLKKFNISLYSFEDLKLLIDKYSIDRKNIKPIINLYAHNENAYKQVVKDLDLYNSTSVIHATGTGKSKIFLKLSGEHYYDKDKLIIAPSHYILNQFKNSSDNWALNKTTYMTYNKLSRLTKEEIEQLNVDLLCIDELHRCGAKVWSQKINILIEHMKKNKDSKIIGLTATPIRCDSERKNMVDELFEGRYSSFLSIQEAIVKGILPMPKYISSIISLNKEVEEIKNRINTSDYSDEEKLELTSKINDIIIDWEKSNGVVEILKKHIDFKEGKGLVFCESIEHANEMEETVRRWFKRAGFNIRTNMIHCQNNNNESEIEEFKNSNYKNTIHLLFSVNSLNEGVHFESGNNVKFTIFLRKTSSEIVYLQQLGRVLQSNQTNNPIIFDLVCNFKNASATSFYNSFVNELRNTNSIRNSIGLNNLKTTEEDLQTFIYDESQVVEEILANFSNSINAAWERKYNKFKKYYLTYGDYTKICTIDPKLKSWIHQQRVFKRKGLLPLDRIEKLNEINFIWEPAEEFWLSNYMALKEFYMEHGHTNIPQKYPKNVTLGRWVNNQRTLYKGGNLSMQKIDKLNEINFIWDVQEDTWNRFIDRFKKFYEENNHGNIPQKYPQDQPLGTWVANQRKLRNRGALSEEKIKILDSIGFIWEPQEEAWMNYFNKLKEYISIHGDTRVKLKHVDQSFYQWVITQRRFYKMGKLSEQKIELLNSIGFIWSKNSN